MSTIYVYFIVLLYLAQYRTCFDIRDVIFVYVVIMMKARGFHGALRKHSLLHQKFKFQKYFYTLIEFNTFHKHSADSNIISDVI